MADEQDDLPPMFTTPIHEQFRVALAALNVVLPLSVHKVESGVVVDANGRDVFTVDVNRERPDLEVEQICFAIILACNGAGGINTFALEAGSNG